MSKRSYVFLIAFRLAAFANAQNFVRPSLYSTWKTAFPWLVKNVVYPPHSSYCSHCSLTA